ncbi:MAG: hypothetical protein HQK49_06260 [Oligoflexia bacterium]|nr:hypothetical protein [Oligoflexia bacterium]
MFFQLILFIKTSFEFFIFILLIIITTSKTSGFECKKINLTAPPNGVMSKMKVLDQGSHNLCYSYVLKQLMEAKIKNKFFDFSKIKDNLGLSSFSKEIMNISISAEIMGMASNIDNIDKTNSLTFNDIKNINERLDKILGGDGGEPCGLFDAVKRNGGICNEIRIKKNNSKYIKASNSIDKIFTKIYSMVLDDVDSISAKYPEEEVIFDYEELYKYCPKEKSEFIDEDMATEMLIKECKDYNKNIKTNDTKIDCSLINHLELPSVISSLNQIKLIQDTPISENEDEDENSIIYFKKKVIDDLVSCCNIFSYKDKEKYSYNKLSPLYGANIDKIIKHAKKKMNKNTKVSKKDMSSMICSLLKIKDAIGNYINENHQDRIMEARKARHAFKVYYGQCIDKFNLNNNPQIKDFIINMKDIMIATHTLEANRLWSSMKKSFCSDTDTEIHMDLFRSIFDKIECKTVEKSTYNNVNNFIEDIEKSLSKENMPIGIGIHLNGLLQEKISFDEDQNDNNDDNDKHGVVVVGMETVDNDCYIRIRNSYGEANKCYCSNKMTGYDSYEKICLNRSTKYHYLQWKCDDQGNYLIPANKLYDNLLSLKKLE